MVIARAALPRSVSGLGVLILGLSWSVGVLLANADLVAQSGLSWAVALLHIGGGGLATVGAVWFGIGAVAWAMARLLGARPGFLLVLCSIGAAFPPLWVAAPAVAFLQTGSGAGYGALVALAVAGVVGFTAVAASCLQDATGLSPRRAWMCVGLVALFCMSVLSLTS